MKRIAAIVAGLMLALPLYANAKGMDVHQDKSQHIGACYAAELTLKEMKPFSKWKPWQRVLFNVAVIGGGKEWYDHNHPSAHSAEWGDIAANAVGAVMAEGTVWLIHRKW